MEKELRINLTSAFDSKGIDNAKRSFSELERESLRAVSSQRNISAATSDASKSVDNLSERIGFMGHAYVGFQAVIAGSSYMSELTKDAIRQADTWNLLEGRLRLVTDSTQQLVSVQADLFDIAQESRTGYEQNADLYARIARATQDLNKTQYENLDVTEAISKSFIVSGASAESAKAAVIQLGQGFASGTLRGEELNSVLEQAPRLAEAIADGMGVSVGQLKKMGEEGKLTAEKVYEAIRTQKNAIEEEFDQMPKTVGQSLVVLTNQIGLTIHEFDQMHGVTASIGTAITGVSDILKEHSGEIGDYVGYVGGAVSAILVWKLTAEATSYAIGLQTSATEVSTVATVANSAANTRAAISAIGHSGAIASVTTATTASTLATNALAASTSYLSSIWKSNPLGVGITALYLLYEAVNTLGDGFVTSEAKARDFRNEIKNLSDEILKGKIVEMTAELSSVQKEMNKLSTGNGSDYVNPIYRIQADNATALSYKIREMQELRKESGAVLKDEFKNAESAYNSLVSIGARTPGKLSKQMEKQIADAKFVKDELQKAIKGDISPSSVKKSISNLPSDKELKDAAKAAEQLKKLNQDLNDEIFKATASEYEKSMKLIDDGVAKFRDGGANKIKIAQLVSLKQEEYLETEYAKAVGQFDALDKETTEKTKSRLAISEDMYQSLNEMGGNWYDNEMLNISNKSAELAKAGISDLEVIKYFNSSVIAINKETTQKQIDAYQSMSDRISQIDIGSTMSFSPTGDEGVDRFASMLTGMGQINDMYLKQAEIEKQIAADRKKIDEDQMLSIEQKLKLKDELNKKENDLHHNSFKNEIASAAHTIALSKNVFKEKTAAHKTFSAIEKALNVASIALEAQKQIAILMTATTSTAASGVIVAGKTTEAVASATAGIANQASGDPYTAFPRIAAMIGLMGSVLAMGGIAFGGGGSSAASVPPPDESMGTVLGGGVYGQSESITNITDLLDSIHVSEYAELRDINRAVTSMAQGIESAITNIFRSGITDTSGVQLSPAVSGIGLNTASNIVVGVLTGGLGLIADKLLGGFLTSSVSSLLGAIGLGGSSKQYIAGSGFKVAGGTLGSKADGNVGASTYVDVETASKNFWGSASYSHNITTTALDEESSKSIALIYDSFQTTMEEINKGLGTDLGDSIAGYAVKAINISTAGLTGDEVVKKLNDTFSALGDTMANDVFGETLDQYQKLGEGMLETAVRVITEKAVVLQDLGDIGITVNGDILSVSQSLVELSGSLGDFQDSISAYYDKFFSDEEKLARSQDKFLGLFTDLGYTLPTTTQSFRDIVDALDLSTASGQETFTTLMSSSTAFYEFASAVEESTKSATDSIFSTVNTFISAFDELKKSTQSLIYSLTIPTTTSGKQDYLITQYHDLKKSFMSNFDSNGMADANSIEKMKSDYGLLTNNISALSSAGINDMMKSALVTELGSFESLFAKNDQAVKVEVVAGMLSVADQAKALGLTESQVSELQKSNGYSSTQIDTLYSISTAQATNQMLGSVNEWVKSLYDVQSQARALDTASLTSSSFAAGHQFGTQEKIDFAQKTGLTIGSESFNKAITDIQGFSTQSNDTAYLQSMVSANNISSVSALKSLGSIAPGDTTSALSTVTSDYQGLAPQVLSINRSNAAETARPKYDKALQMMQSYLYGGFDAGSDHGKTAFAFLGSLGLPQDGGIRGNQSAYNSFASILEKKYSDEIASMQYSSNSLQNVSGLVGNTSFWGSDLWGSFSDLSGLSVEQQAIMDKYLQGKSVLGFSSGGYTGNGGVNEIAGFVHGQEMVLNAPTTKALGLNEGNGGIFKELLAEIKALKKEVTDLKQINSAHMMETVSGNNVIKRVTNGGNAMMTEAV